jgi:CRP-like cAMP-binding protein
VQPDQNLFQTRSVAGKTDKNYSPVDLSRETREQIYEIATALSFRRGTAIFSQGADAQFLYFIDEGIVRISRFAENGHRQVLGFQMAGDLIGLSENGQYANLAETLRPVRVHRVSWNQMHGLMLAEPKLLLALFNKVVHDSLRAQALIMVLGQQNTHRRLAACLINLMTMPQFFDEESECLYLPVNRFDLADYLGVTSRSAERAFSRLEEGGLVRRLTPRIIEILDMDRLKRLQLEQQRSHH